MPEEVFGEEIARFEALGLLKNGKRDIELTYKGALVGEEVCGSFASESALPLRQKEHVAAGL
jgi:hypothetical protein